MLSHCLKCKKDRENVNPKVLQKMVEQCYHQNVMYAARKSQDL